MGCVHHSGRRGERWGKVERWPIRRRALCRDSQSEARNRVLETDGQWRQKSWKVSIYWKRNMAYHRHFDIRGEDREGGKLQKVVFFVGRVAWLTAVIINTDFFLTVWDLVHIQKAKWILFGIFKSKPHTGLYVAIRVRQEVRACNSVQIRCANDRFSILKFGK